MVWTAIFRAGLMSNTNDQVSEAKTTVASAQWQRNPAGMKPTLQTSLRAALGARKGPCQQGRTALQARGKRGGSMTIRTGPTLHVPIPSEAGAASQPQAQFQETAISNCKYHKSYKFRIYMQCLLPISQHKNLCRLSHKMQRFKWVKIIKHKLSMTETSGSGARLGTFDRMGNENVLKLSGHSLYCSSYGFSYKVT